MNPLLFEILSFCLGILTDELSRKPTNSGELKMSIKTFGQSFGATKSTETGSKADRPKAQYWLNLGYTANEGTEEAKFISLPTGIPLDTQEPLDIKSNNEDFRAMRCAQNDLLEQLMQFAQSLEPGEEGIIQLQVQLRRVKADAVPIAADENKYSRKLTF